MAKAWLSIRGLYDYDATIFDDVNFPGALDKSVIVDKILADNAELGLVYTDPYRIRELLRIWSKTHENAFQRIYTALTEEYNPIHNYDRNEEWEDKGEAVNGVMGYNSESFTDANRMDSGTTRKGRAWGNIGVTTSAQMIQGEIDIRTQNTYAQIISDSFRAEFCIMVY